MTRTYTDAEIAALAIDFARLRYTARKLVAERNACKCAHESEDDEYGRGGFDGDRHAVCWRPDSIDHEGEPTYLPRDQWCPSCVRRDALHGEAIELRKRAGIASGRLTRAMAHSAVVAAVIAKGTK